MKWHHVQDNWPAFFEAITERWPDADEAGLEDVDGDQRAFIQYIADLTGQEPGDARDEIREWLAGELPSDVVMDPRHNDHSILLSAKYLDDTEDKAGDEARYGDEAESEEPLT